MLVIEGEYIVIPDAPAGGAKGGTTRVKAEWTIGGKTFRPLDHLPFKIKDWKSLSARGVDVMRIGTKGIGLDDAQNIVLTLCDKVGGGIRLQHIEDELTLADLSALCQLIFSSEQLNRPT